MNNLEMLKQLKELTDEKNDAILLTYLGLAAEVILERRYPFREDIKEVPKKYHGRQIEIAAYLLNKRGAEGQTSHSENGISRGYESASVPESMLKGIIPQASLLSKKRSEEI